MSRADPHRALLRALALRHPALTVTSARTEPWASVTFTGMRHTLRCAPGVDVAGIEEAAFMLPGHIVIDITAAHEDGALVIEALTIEDA